jgi:4-alpha-glucanotransferase
MNCSRGSGILLHPTSLPGPYGIGTLGTQARAFVDFLAKARVGYWQILPLGPTGYGDSPYQSLSAFAGNPYLIDPDELMRLGLLNEAETGASPEGGGRVDFGALFSSSNSMLDSAWKRFSNLSESGNGAEIARLKDEFAAFERAQAWWLEDFALYSAIKETQGFASWDSWPPSLKKREAKSLEKFRAKAADRILRHKFAQFLFFRQWKALKTYANAHNVRIIGDIPIFAAYDSADTWAKPELFQLDAALQPKKVAGVPPDYFTDTGQLWGNPLYDWEAHKKTGYAWWVSRIKASLECVDLLRIDHFRGFVDYWAVPAEHTTAARGSWESGPGMNLFAAVASALGELPIIAEDLGFMTPEVHALRDSLGFPGMKILQFAFEPEGENADYPHLYPENSVVYTGTHDNDTSAGWLRAAAPSAAKRALSYTKGRPASFAWDMIRTAWASPAKLAVAPMQDVLGLGSEARMNYPGKIDGYWTWRMPDSLPYSRHANKLARLNAVYFRSSRV